MVSVRLITIAMLLKQVFSTGTNIKTNQRCTTKSGSATAVNRDQTQAKRAGEEDYYEKTADNDDGDDEEDSSNDDVYIVSDIKKYINTSSSSSLTSSSPAAAAIADAIHMKKTIPSLARFSRKDNVVVII